jgi:pyruvate,water dikinase
MALTRLALLQIGRGLVKRGLLDDPADIFLLTYEQLLAATSGDGENYRAIAAANRADIDASRALTPPPFIGPPPAGSPTVDSPLLRGLSRTRAGPPQDSGDPNIIKGAAGSRGEVTAPAFVARTLEEASAIQPGQVLVAVTTLPAWTPLFGVAAAVVTDTGGPLSHCAVVAREYAIPAVVGARDATQRITTGQRITVDGSSGTVTLHN